MCGAEKHLNFDTNPTSQAQNPKQIPNSKVPMFKTVLL
jgi:hypothetical protein